MVQFEKTLAGALLVAAPLLAQTTDNKPVDPFRIADNVYYVGSSDIAATLVTSPAGHILIDAGYEETVPQIKANVAKLGFRLSNIKILLNSQAHFDHAGGFAELRRLTGARLIVSDQDAVAIENGGRGDFNFGDKYPFRVVTVDGRVRDGEHIVLGPLDLVAHLTPGHTKGTTTWTFDTRDRGRVYHVVFVGGLTILEGTKLTGTPSYPQIVQDYEHTFRTMKSLPCDIFLGAHASYYGGMEKAARMRANPNGLNPFVDPDGYRTFVELAEKRFRDQLAREGRNRG